MHYSTGIGALSIILLLVPESFADPALLVDKGQPRSCIVLPAALTDKRVLTAAHELAGYIEQMSGARPPVQRDDKPLLKGGFRILIGSTKLAAHLDVPASISEEKVGLDGFIIRSVANGLVIVGRTDLATANGVYHFAEEVLGGHWFSPEDDGPTFPKRTTIEIPKLDRTVKPDFWWRGQYYSFQQINDAYKKNSSSFAKKLNANRDRWWTFNRLWSAAAPESGHAFSQIVPEGLFAAHPEFFPYVDYRFEKSNDPTHPYGNVIQLAKGARIKGNDSVQRCLSNPDVLKLAVEWTANRFKKDPDLKFTTLSANDFPWWCRCDKCKAMGKTDSHRNLAFVNAVARANEQRFPERGYIFYAYEATLDPPVGMKVHRDVIPMIAPLRHCRVHPLSSQCPDLKDERQIINGWAQISKRIAWRPYLNGGPFTTPGVITMAEEMRLLRDSGSVGGFREHQFPPRVGWPMLNWMEAKLLWDVDQDPAKLRCKFIKGYYGPAGADSMERVYDKLETALRTTNLRKQWPEGHNAMVESAEFLKPLVAACQRDMDAAVRAVQSEPKILRYRVERDIAYLKGELPANSSDY